MWSTDPWYLDFHSNVHLGVSEGGKDRDTYRQLCTDMKGDNPLLIVTEILGLDVHLVEYKVAWAGNQGVVLQFFLLWGVWYFWPWNCHRSEGVNSDIGRCSYTFLLAQFWDTVSWPRGNGGFWNHFSTSSVFPEVRNVVAVHDSSYSKNGNMFET